MKCSPRFRWNKRYIKNSNKLSLFIFYAVFLAPYGATEKTWQYFMQEDFPHEILPRPAAAKMLSNCKHAHKP